MPRPSPLSLSAEAPKRRRADRRACRRQRSSRFPRPIRSHEHRYSCLTRQHGLVTLTFWPWKWCSSHVWRGLPLC